MRDYLNEGGKLLHAGETTQYYGLPGISDAVGGIFYGLNGGPGSRVRDRHRPDDPQHPDFFADCLILADDFRQYYLGVFTRSDTADPRRSRARRAAVRLRRRARRPVVRATTRSTRRGCSS